MKTPRESVEEAEGHWPTSDCPTDGYLRAALRVVGDDPRGMSREKMLTEARRAGLPFKDKAQESNR